MMHWNLGWGAMMIGGVGMLSLWVLLVGLVFWGIRSFIGGDGSSPLQANGVQPTPLEILHRRYASGEITREEYETIHHDLNST